MAIDYQIFAEKYCLTEPTPANILKSISSVPKCDLRPCTCLKGKSLISNYNLRFPGMYVHNFCCLCPLAIMYIVWSRSILVETTSLNNITTLDHRCFACRLWKRDKEWVNWIETPRIVMLFQLGYSSDQWVLQTARFWWNAAACILPHGAERNKLWFHRYKWTTIFLKSS
jgi:hypothetical protein